MRRAALVAALLGLAPVAAAEPVTVRMATVAPEGTAWARVLRAYTRDVSEQTKGEVLVKWYLGGIAGDDVQAADRIRRGQLDGVASGGMLCERVSPLMRAIHVVTRTSDEASYLYNRLAKDIESEVEQTGYVYIGAAALGPDVVFSREPVRNLEELKRPRLWIWDLDEAISLQMPGLGIHGVPLPVNDAARAYDHGQLDGFVALPGAAVAFQWSSQARYVTPLSMGFVTGCVLVSRRTFDALPLDARQALYTATAKMRVRMTDLEEQQDSALLGGLFARQGLHILPVSAAFQAEFDRAAAAVQEQLGAKLVPQAQLERVRKLLDEYHHQHAERHERP